MAELINRPQYLNQLIQNKDVDLVKIVTGIRRSGKSSLLDLFHQYLLQNGIPDSNIIHMNMLKMFFVLIIKKFLIKVIKELYLI